MQKFLVFISLFIPTCLTVFAGDRWDNASREEIWLQEPDMYNPRYNVSKSLPNGYQLLYKEDGLGDYSARRNRSMREYSERHLDLSLVKIQSPEGRMFLGLAEPQRDGNYLPVYGVIDGKEAVLYDYDIYFKKLSLPKKLTGKWYAPLFREMFEDADTHWKQTHAGRENKYPAHGFVDDGSAYSYLFLPYIEEDYLTFGDKPEYQFVKIWSNEFPRMELGELTVKKSNGRKKSMVQETGGYIIDADVDKWYTMNYDWNPENGTLTLKFGPKVRTKYNVDWHNWEGPKDTYNDNDFKNVNPGAAYMRVTVPKWAQQSPDNVWGQISVKVYAVTDRFMVVSGKSVQAGWNFTEVWAAENYEGGLLTTNRRKEIVEALLDRCVMVRQANSAKQRKAEEEAAEKARIEANRLAQQRAAEQQAAEQEALRKASVEANSELMKTQWMPFLSDVFNAYRSGWTAYKAERGKYETPNIKFARGWIVSDVYQKLTAKYGKAEYEKASMLCSSFISAINDDLLSAIVESRDVEPYDLVNEEVSFLIGTKEGVKKLVYKAEFQPKDGSKDKMDGEWCVKDVPTLVVPEDILQTLNQKRQAFDMLDVKEQKTLKKNYSNEIKALQKTPKSVKDFKEAINACETLSEHLK